MTEEEQQRQRYNLLWEQNNIVDTKDFNKIIKDFIKKNEFTLENLKTLSGSELNDLAKNLEEILKNIDSLKQKVTDIDPVEQKVTDIKEEDFFS
ncbi:hypothetical protein CVV26_00230 [Candidatus Kuenenbacteria bacterium HGW-Kuenenbacteria-1]|uniref:Uncharacterized protein n=1 Tax=Candidatus Kuenenbacteria bacterium HGW-Kuenenbacteria-1 TaxID=2013812 RepID=A0A2N1UPC0_9BACT|nr:MAG: hypothetical protein CVV26_00230 [Candidatus Kuenenbacteria bacterium HGW-Kuenenbacteria-1]